MYNKNEILHRRYVRDNNGRFAAVPGSSPKIKSSSAKTSGTSNVGDSDDANNTPKKKRKKIGESIDNLDNQKISNVNKNVSDAQKNIVTARNILNSGPAKKQTYESLEQYSNDQLQEMITRGRLEHTYNQLCGEIKSSKIDKGKRVMDDTLKYAGGGLAIAGTALSIALSVKQLRS